MNFSEAELTNLLKSINTGPAREVVLSYEGDQEDYDHFINVICKGLFENISKFIPDNEISLNREFLNVVLQIYSLDPYPTIYNTKTAKLLSRRLKQLKDFQSFSRQKHKLSSIKLVYNSIGDNPAFNNTKSVSFEDEDFHDIFLLYLERLQNIVEDKIEGHQKVVAIEKAITKLRRQRDSLIKSLYSYLYPIICSASERKQANLLAEIIGGCIQNKDDTKEIFSGNLEEHCRNVIKLVGKHRKN